MEQLTGIDASFVYLDTPKTPMHIGGVLFFEPPEGGFDLERYLALIDSRVHLSRVFRRRLITVPFGLDHPYWIEDPNFNLEAHVHHMALPRPGGWPQLRRLVEHIFSVPLDLRRPLWSLTFVQGLDGIEELPPGAFAMVHKIHHAAVDGMGGRDLLTSLVDATPEVHDYPPEDEWMPDMRPGGMRLLAKACAHLATRPVTAARMLQAFLGGAWDLGREALIERRLPAQLPFRAPRTRFNAPVSPTRVFGGTFFSLDKIRAMRTAVPGATVNDVVLTICSGALARYLDEHDELPEESLTAMAPISVRGTVSEGGNQVSAMLVDLATTVADPLERLTALRENTARSKEQSNAVGARTLTDAAQIVPFSLGIAAARLYTRMEIAKYHRPLFNLVTTNVPGPREPLYMGGARMANALGSAPITDGLGIILVITSYVDKLSISITSCPEMLPDIELLEQCMQEAFDELGAACVARKPARKKTTRKTGGTGKKKAAAKKPRPARKKASAKKAQPAKKRKKKNTKGPMNERQEEAH